MTIKILFMALILLSALTCKPQNDTKTSVINIETLKSDAIGKDVQLIDVRTAEEYNAGHIDDAINIDVLQLESFLDKAKQLDKSKPVYVYCKVGGRSKLASEKLQELGFSTIYDFSAGYSGWVNQ